jgi:hypothetical protein
VLKGGFGYQQWRYRAIRRVGFDFGVGVEHGIEILTFFLFLGFLFFLQDNKFNI